MSSAAAFAVVGCVVVYASYRLADARRRFRHVAAAYARDGFVAPLRILSASEAAEALAALDAHEMACGGALHGDARFKLHLLYPWAAKLVRHPRLTKAVAAALGTNDLLVWSSDINAKPAATPTFASAHQDSTYANLEPADGALTAWLALTDAPSEAGCLVFAAGSHRLGQVHHTETHAPDNLLSLGQRIDGFDESSGGDGTAAELLAGEASLHSFRTIHWSGPNRSKRRRVGFAIRYVRADIGRAEGGRRARESATLVRGHYTPSQGAFDLEPEPQHAAGEAERASHQDAMARERQNYFQSDCSRRVYK